VRRLGRIAPAIAILTWAPSTPVAAQPAAASAAVGQRVRIVTQSGEQLIGQLRAVLADTLVVAVRGAQGVTELKVPPSGTRALYASRGRSTRAARAANGALFGAFAGGVVGAVLGAGCGECEGDVAVRATAFVPAGGALGALLGALLGLTGGAGERWQEVPWPPQPAPPR
jgi:hypothetical protein